MDSNLSDLSNRGKRPAPVGHVNHSITGLDDQFGLFCWVLNKSDRPFSVKIGKSETVDGLKKVIKKEKEHSLVGIDANTLNIWEVSTSWLVSMRRSDILEAILTDSFC